MPPKFEIDLVSDTASMPTEEMLEAMMSAPLGDEQRNEDPTVMELNSRVAALLGQDNAIFLPSGTMCNQIAIAVHCQPGDEIIAAHNSHIISSEGAGAAVFAQSVIQPINNTYNGIFSVEDLHGAVRKRTAKAPRSRLVSIEQTSNRGGGSVWPLETVSAINDAAHELGLQTHLDGARLLNACIAAHVQPVSYAAKFDSVWIDLSKGLGCPVGAVLAGSSCFIDQATRWKHRMGGAMRQAGILAAAGLYALDNNVRRLVDDHKNAKRFAKQVSQLPGVNLVFDKIETNLVFFDISETNLTTEDISQALARRGIRIGVESRHVMRAVFHISVNDKATDKAASVLKEIIEMS